MSSGNPSISPMPAIGATGGPSSSVTANFSSKQDFVSSIVPGTSGAAIAGVAPRISIRSTAPESVATALGFDGPSPLARPGGFAMMAFPARATDKTCFRGMTVPASLPRDHPTRAALCLFPPRLTVRRRARRSAARCCRSAHDAAFAARKKWRVSADFCACAPRDCRAGPRARVVPHPARSSRKPHTAETHIERRRLKLKTPPRLQFFSCLCRRPVRRGGNKGRSS